MHTSNTVVQGLNKSATQISNTDFVSRISMSSREISGSAQDKALRGAA